MNTTAARTVRSVPHRDAHATWDVIVDLLTRGQDGDRRRELQAVAGIASTLIAEERPAAAPIIAICDGPRTRIYCVFDDKALDPANGNEDSLGFDPLKGEWRVSLPCAKDDLEWVNNALKKHSSRITARDLDDGIAVGDDKASASQKGLTLDVESFLK